MGTVNHPPEIPTVNVILMECGQLTSPRPKDLGF